MVRPGTSVRRAIGVLCCVVSAACADESGEPAGPPASGSGTVTGSVTRHKTGVGVPDLVAVVQSQGRIRDVTVTDDAGRFAFSGLPSGAYTVHLTGRDLAGLDNRYNVLEPDSAVVVVGGGPPDVVFTVLGLIPPRITGDIVCAGVAAAGAQVRVVGGGTDTVVVANAQGRYAALDLEPGTYAVLPVAAPCEVSPAYRVVELRPGQAGDVDFTG